MTENTKNLQELAEAAGWTEEEFNAEVIIFYSSFVGSLLEANPKLKAVEQHFNLGEKVLYVKSTLETIN